MFRLATTAASLLLLFSTGCATVKFYEDDLLTKETGLQYHSPKPYLLVAKTGAKDKPVEVQVIYLPDLTKPRFAKYRPGLGTHEFTLNLSNGILTSYGQKADSKIPETIQAVGSLATSLASAAATGGLVPQGLDFAERKKIASDLRAAAVAIDADVAAPAVANALTPNQTTEADNITDKLAAAAAISDDPSGDAKAAAKILREDVVAKIGDIKVSAPGANANLVNYNGKIDSHQSDFGAIADKLDPPPKTATFTLFEIVQANGKTTLVPVTQ